MYSVYYDRRDGSVGYRYARAAAICAGHARHVHVTSNAAGDGRRRPNQIGFGFRSCGRHAPDGRPMIVLFAESARRKMPATSKARLSAPSASIFPAASTRISFCLNRVFILAAGTIAGVLAIITFYFITTRLILQPVRVLQENRRQSLARRFEHPPPTISTGDEFQQLSETFNVIADELERVGRSAFAR